MMGIIDEVGIALTAQELVDVLRALHGLQDDQGTAVMARLKQLQRLKLFGASPVGRGRNSVFLLSETLRAVIIFELIAAGLRTAEAGRIVDADWSLVLCALKTGWKERRLKPAKAALLVVETSLLKEAGRPRTISRGKKSTEKPAQVSFCRSSIIAGELAQKSARRAIILRPDQIAISLSNVLSQRGLTESAFGRILELAVGDDESGT